MYRFPHPLLASLLIALPPLSIGVLTLSRDEAKGGFGDPIHGQRVFVERGCVRCHAVRGAGGRIGPDLGRTTRSSYYEIASLMWNHSQGMGRKMAEFRIARSTFDDDELLDLISFLSFLNYFDEPGDPDAGKILFTEKHCIRCHRVGETGGLAGPPLDSIPRGVSPLHIAEKLWNHGPAMISAIESAGLELPKFEGSEIIDLFAYVRSHGERQGARRFQSPGDPESGGRIFEDKGCSACHPIFGDEPGVGPDLGRAELRGSVTQIAGRMWNHWPNMARTMEKAGMTVPEFGEGELLDLLAYIFIARYEDEPGDPGRGRLVYEGKGCSVCHGPDGQGDVGSPLRDVLVGRTEESIMQGMWNHAPKMGALMRDQDLSWVRLLPRELADLLAFLSIEWPEPPGDAE